jgi:hypothetical protein
LFQSSDISQVDFMPRLSRTSSLDVDYQISPGARAANQQVSGPEINPYSQVWQTPVRHDQRIRERVVMAERVMMAMTGYKS